MKINIDAIHFTADKKLKENLQNRLEKLEKYFNKIIEADVTLKLENSGKIKDKVVEIQLNVPGTMICYSATSKKFEKSIEECMSGLRRQVIKYKERRRSR